MKLFNFFRKARHEGVSNLGKILTPKECLTEISPEIIFTIDNINWESFETAYGNAKETIPFYLKNLYCKDIEIAMHATHQLWCSLCHQNAFISTAALPSYEILRTGLLQLEDKLKIELLDIFEGFANCTNPTFGNTERQTWELELRQKLITDITLFKEFSTHPDELISTFASNIVSNLKAYKNFTV